MEIVKRKYLTTKTPTCHASTSVFYQGEPVFAWFGGRREGEPDSAIYIKKGDHIYGIGTDKRVARWNPILFTHEDQLYVFVKAGVFCDRWQTFLYNITDIASGNIPNPQVIPAGLNGPVKTAPIFKDGLMYCGSAVETSFDWTSYIEIFEMKNGALEFVDRTAPIVAEKEMIATRMGMALSSKGIIQPALWFEGDTLHSVFRSSSGLGKIYYAQGEYENGRLKMDSFATKTSLENPNSGVDVAQVNDDLYLVYNPSDIKRNPLCVAKVKRNDRDFEIEDEIAVLEEVDIDDMTYTGELSYPYMIEENGQLHLTYTYGRSKIEYVVIDV
jgi:predicted neuraminidase